MPKQIIATFLLPLTAWCSEIPPATSPTKKQLVVESIQVIDEIKRGVPAQIMAINDHEAKEPFSETDDSGTAAPKKTCERGTRYKAVAKVKYTYRTSEPVECAASMPFILRKNRVAIILLNEGRVAYQRGDYETSALLSFEAAARLESIDSAAVKEAQIQGYSSLTQLFEPSPGENLFIFDTGQNQAVLTAAGIREFKALQEAKGLKPTGVVDSKTLQLISGKSVGFYLKSAYIRSDE